MIRLFTTLYPESCMRRFAEYVDCLEKNLANSFLDEVCLLIEGKIEQLPDSPKLRLRQIGQRPHYSDFFEWINELAGTDDISIITNTDIWFDGSIGAVAHTLGRMDCYALARWEGDRLWDRNDSQDCWIFRGNVAGVSGEFALGIVRCDNRILYELQTAGYSVTNPAFSIRSFHLHEGQRSEYGANEAHFIQPPYRYLWPHNLLGPLQTIWQNLQYPHHKLGWRFDSRRWGPMQLIRAARFHLGTLRLRIL